MINVETYGTNIMFPIGEKRVSEHFSIRLGGATLAVFAHSHESPPAEGFPNYDNPDAEPPEPDRYVAQIISEKFAFAPPAARTVGGSLQENLSPEMIRSVEGEFNISSLAAVERLIDTADVSPVLGDPFGFSVSERCLLVNYVADWLVREFHARRSFGNPWLARQAEDYSYFGQDVTGVAIGDRLQEVVHRHLIGAVKQTCDTEFQVAALYQLSNDRANFSRQLEAARRYFGETRETFIRINERLFTARQIDQWFNFQASEALRDVDAIYEEARSLARRVVDREAVIQNKTRSPHFQMRIFAQELRFLREEFNRVVHQILDESVEHRAGFERLCAIKHILEIRVNILMESVRILFEAKFQLMDETTYTHEFYQEWLTSSLNSISRMGLNNQGRMLLRAIADEEMDYARELNQEVNFEERGKSQTIIDPRPDSFLDLDVDRMMERALVAKNEFRADDGIDLQQPLDRHNFQFSSNGEAVAEERVSFPSVEEIAAPHLGFRGFLGGTAMNMLVIGASHLCVAGYSRYIVGREATAAEQFVVGGIPIAASMLWSVTQGAHLSHVVAHFPLGLASFIAIDCGVASAEEMLGINPHSTFGNISRLVISSALATAAPYATVLGVSATAAGLSLPGILLTVGSGAAVGAAFYAGVWMGGQVDRGVAGFFTGREDVSLSDWLAEGMYRVTRLFV